MNNKKDNGNDLSISPVNNKNNNGNDLSISSVNNKMNNSNISISIDSVEIIKNSPFKDNKNDISDKSIDKNYVSVNNKEINELDDNKGVFHNSAKENNKIVVYKNNSLAINKSFFDSSVKDPLYKSSIESNKLSVDNISSININSKEEAYKYKFRNIKEVISFSEQNKNNILKNLKIEINYMYKVKADIEYDPLWKEKSKYVYGKKNWINWI